jgi:hypothetical protein
MFVRKFWISCSLQWKTRTTKLLIVLEMKFISISRICIWQNVLMSTKN